MLEAYRMTRSKLTASKQSGSATIQEMTLVGIPIIFHVDLHFRDVARNVDVPKPWLIQ